MYIFGFLGGQLNKAGLQLVTCSLKLRNYFKTTKHSSVEGFHLTSRTVSLLPPFFFFFFSLSFSSLNIHYLLLSCIIQNLCQDNLTSVRTSFQKHCLPRGCSELTREFLGIKQGKSLFRNEHTLVFKGGTRFTMSNIFGIGLC